MARLEQGAPTHPWTWFMVGGMNAHSQDSFPQSFMEGSKSLLPFGEPEALETKMGWEVQGFSDCQWPSEGSRLPRDLVYV